MRRATARVGLLPATAFVGVAYLVALLAVMTLPKPFASVAIVAAPIVVGLYCLCRTSRGWEVLGIGAFPSAASAIAVSLGLPRAPVGWAAAAASLAVLLTIDREERAARNGPAV